jgi:polyhydroxybutyrate depolymerase
MLTKRIASTTLALASALAIPSASLFARPACAKLDLSVENLTCAEPANSQADFLPLPINADRKSLFHYGTNKLSMKVGGIRRTFTLFIPRGLRVQDRPALVFVLHGALGDGESARWNCQMNAEAEKRKFYLIYPDATGIHTWNAGDCCGFGKLRKTRDVAFISDMIDFMELRLNTDSRRVFVAGLSNGGMMAYRLGIELSDKIAAIGPVEGAMEFHGSPKAPVSVVAIHGKHDHVVKYDGKVGSWFFVPVHAPSVSESVGYWVSHDHCSEKPITEFHEGYSMDLYKNGDMNTEVCLYSVEKGTHTWPGGKEDHILHPVRSRNLSASVLLCDFFFSHPKKIASAETSGVEPLR